MYCSNTFNAWPEFIITTPGKSGAKLLKVAGPQQYKKVLNKTVLVPLSRRPVRHIDQEREAAVSSHFKHQPLNKKTHKASFFPQFIKKVQF